MKRYGFEKYQRIAKGGLSFGIALVFSSVMAANVMAASEESRCVACHTNSRELIKIAQIILKQRPPAKSEETKGEG